MFRSVPFRSVLFCSVLFIKPNICQTKQQQSDIDLLNMPFYRRKHNKGNLLVDETQVHVFLAPVVGHGFHFPPQRVPALRPDHLCIFFRVANYHGAYCCYLLFVYWTMLYCSFLVRLQNTVGNAAQEIHHLTCYDQYLCLQTCIIKIEKDVFPLCHCRDWPRL